MNESQRSGAIVILITLALMAIALILSSNWGRPGYPLFLFIIEELPVEYDSPLKALEHTIFYTKYVLALLMLPLTYGVLLFFSLCHNAFIRHRPTHHQPTAEIIDKWKADDKES